MKNIPALTAEAKYHRVLIILFGVYIIALCALSFLAYPIADDYSYPLKIRNTAFWNYYITIYNTWSGRFASNLFLPLLGNMNPHIAVYKTLPIFLIMTFSASVYYFIISFFKQSRIISLFLTAAFSATYFSGYVSPGQGIYWMSGGFTYQIAFNAFIATLGSMSLLSGSTGKSYLFHAATMLCIIIAAGCNEVTMFSTATVVLFSAIVAILHRHKNRNIFIAYAAITLTLCCIATFAPGNFARADASTRPASFIIWLGIVSLRALGGGFEAFKWLALSPFLLFIAAASPFLTPRFQGNIIPGWSNKKNAMLALAILWLSFFWDYFISIWSSGKHPYARINNAIYTDVLMASLAFYAVYIGPRISERIRERIRVRHHTLCWCLAAAVLLMPNTLDIVRNTLNGDFATYYSVVSTQYHKASQAADNGSCVLPTSPVAPRPVFFRHLDDPDKTWILRVFKIYWNLKEVQFTPLPINDDQP